MVEKMGLANKVGAHLVELRIDWITHFNAERDLAFLLNARTLPALVTYRPKWEGGEYNGDEAPRLAALHLADDLGADYEDIELQAPADQFMGGKGAISRTLAPKFEGYSTFGTLSKGQENAPGQPTLEELINLYRVRKITRDTEVYGVVSNPVGYSKSRILHNLAFAEKGINAVYLPL